MIKKLLAIGVILFISSCDEKKPSWPRSCVGEIQRGTVFVMVNENEDIEVNGLKYKSGLIERHYKQLEKSCEEVQVLISMPNGMESSMLFFKLLEESPEKADGMSSVVLVERK